MQQFQREQAVLDSMSANTVLIDQQGEILVANAAWNKFTQVNAGHQDKCGAGNNYIAVCQGDGHTKKIRDGIKQVLTGEMPKFELCYPCHSEKEKRWYSVTAMPYLCDQDNVRALISHHNVTKFVKHQHIAETRENLYSSVINSLMEGVLIQDQRGRIETCNQAAELLLGLSRASMEEASSIVPLQQMWRQDGQPFHVDDYPPIVALQTGQAVCNIIVGLGDDQHVLTWLKVSSQPIFEAPDSLQPSAIVTTLVSVTEELHQNQQLRELSSRFDLAISCAGIGVWDWCIDDGHLIWDDNMFALYRVERNDYSDVYKLWRQCVHPDDIASVERQLQLCLQTNIPFEQDYRIRWPDNSERVIRPFAIVHHDSRGKPVRMVGVNQDVTELSLAQQVLSESQNRLQLLVHNLPVGAVYLEGDRVLMNAAAVTMTGYLQSEIASVSEWFEMLLGEQAVDVFKQYHRDRNAAFPVKRSYEYRHKNGEQRWLEFDGFIYEGGEAWIVVDITERKNTEGKLERLAFFDSLTQLPNRSNFETALNKALFNAERHNLNFALLLLDMDQFKRINDTYGHPIGDKLLVLFSERLKKRLREGDIVARLGGDEFIVLVQNIKASTEIAKLAQCLIAELQAPYDIENDFKVTVSVSIGISLYPSHAKDSMRLLRNADTAMYLAKAKGRNTYRFYSEDLTDAVEKRMAIENQLRKAIQLKQFFVCYQPLFDTVTGLVVGAEALIRWQYQQNYILLPEEFIFIAEELGLMDSVGEWVLQQACEDMARWLKAGFSLAKVSINLSSSQFESGNLSTVILNHLEAAQLPAECLEIEITENTLLSQSDEVEKVASRLQPRGVSFSIDDFGAGYSSLAYLKRSCFDRIKIDRSFIAQIPQDEDGVQLVNTIINMGHNLGFSVVAEGVETQQQLDFLRDLSCDACQGFLLGEPMLACQFEGLLSDASPPVVLNKSLKV
ncbi:MAG: diguanylate cyclase (GGDEF)-like protein/PAS domain S-box-containing protein [Candidatus Endobugula sp.]|jgi:diguanylate cyclase (GGDEF)-like protein/PAS domain S-box-containing protein